VAASFVFAGCRPSSCLIRKEKEREKSWSAHKHRWFVSVYEKNDDAIFKAIHSKIQAKARTKKISKWPRETTALPRDASAQSIERRLKRDNQTYFRSIQPLSPLSKRPIDTNRAHFEPKIARDPQKEGFSPPYFLYIGGQNREKSDFGKRLRGKKKHTRERENETYFLALRHGLSLPPVARLLWSESRLIPIVIYEYACKVL
jgi:hypothetical protein